MEVTQIANILNTITSEVLGDTAVVNEDLSNIVNIGDELFNASQVDNYVKSLVDHIGRVIMVNRQYSGIAPSVLRDSWEYASVMQKITAQMPDAQENDTWNLTDGTSYDPNVFKKPTVSNKFFNSKTTFETQMSFVEQQVKSSFDSAGQVNAFFSMIESQIKRSMTVKNDSLVMRTINNLTAETLHDGFTSGGTTSDFGSGSSVRAVNLLYLYNQANPNNTISNAETAIKTPEFIRFATYTMQQYIYRMGSISKLFNIGGMDRFTPRDLLHVVLLNDFASAADIYLQSDTWHNQLTALPYAERVPYWQGSGVDYSFNSISSINVKSSFGAGDDDNPTIEANGILGVMFDHDALGVLNSNARVTTQYNARAEFVNTWYKQDAQYFNDSNENFVVFFAQASA